MRDIPVGVVDHSQTSLSRVLQQTVAATGIVKFTHSYYSVKEAQAAIDSSEVRAVLIIPQDVSQRLVRHPSVGFGLPPSSKQETSRPIAQWLVDGSDTVIAGSIKSLRNMPLTELLDKPANRNTATFEVTLLYNPEQRSVVNIVPGLVAVILTMTMIMFTSAAIVREQERGNMEMLITTPLSSLELMIGKIFPYIFICASLVLGLVISTIAKNQLQSMQMTIFILLPSILLSGFMFPYEGMPLPAQYIAEALPATHFIRLIRGVVLRDVAVIEMSFDMLWLIAFTCFGLLVSALRFKKTLD